MQENLWTVTIKRTYNCVTSYLKPNW